MSITLRTLAFGVVSGLIWSAVPGTLNSLFISPKETATVITAGLVSGVLTSFALRTHLARARKRVTVLLGAVSLPVGAFMFGFLLSVLQWAFLGHDFTPFSLGFQYALLSMISIFAIVLFPLAILTTFLLRAVIVSSSSHENAA